MQEKLSDCFSLAITGFSVPLYSARYIIYVSNCFFMPITIAKELKLLMIFPAAQLFFSCSLRPLINKQHLLAINLWVWDFFFCYYISILVCTSNKRCILTPLLLIEESRKQKFSGWHGPAWYEKRGHPICWENVTLNTSSDSWTLTDFLLSTCSS